MADNNINESNKDQLLLTTSLGYKIDDDNSIVSSNDNLKLNLTYNSNKKEEFEFDGGEQLVFIKTPNHITNEEHKNVSAQRYGFLNSYQKTNDNYLAQSTIDYEKFNFGNVNYNSYSQNIEPTWAQNYEWTTNHNYSTHNNTYYPSSLPAINKPEQSQSYSESGPANSFTQACTTPAACVVQENQQNTYFHPNSSYFNGNYKTPLTNSFTGYNDGSFPNNIENSYLNNPQYSNLQYLNSASYLNDQTNYGNSFNVQQPRLNDKDQFLKNYKPQTYNVPFVSNNQPIQKFQSLRENINLTHTKSTALCRALNSDNSTFLKFSGINGINKMDCDSNNIAFNTLNNEFKIKVSSEKNLVSDQSTQPINIERNLKKLSKSEKQSKMVKNKSPSTHASAPYSASSLLSASLEHTETEDEEASETDCNDDDTEDEDESEDEIKMSKTHLNAPWIQTGFYKLD